MIAWGVTANHHDASVAVLDGDEIAFASSAERYSRRKNDTQLNDALLAEALTHGAPDVIVWFEKPLATRTREAFAGQHRQLRRRRGATYLKRFGLRAPVRHVWHHESHAAAGFFTSPFDEAAILVVDAIGEWETISAWKGSGRSLTKVWSQRYPHSLGLLYSAFTQRLGMKPNEEEYILMGLAAYGQPIYRDLIWRDFIDRFEPPELVLRHNVHRGIRWWRPELHDRANIAASIQRVAEEVLTALVQWLARRVGTRHLILMGGVALNCVANTKIAQTGVFDDIWVMPNPGDGGSSLGAVAAHARRHLNWSTPFLGHEIRRSFDLDGASGALQAGDLVGIANGRAEFGPRALGNRSLLADPRGPAVKDRVNRVKQREPFRPFAPVILAEHAARYFEMPVASSPYMQFVARVRDPESFPAISHVDGTARVQTVTREQQPNLHALLTSFHVATGCPMLLNTSLNVRGEPLVNTWDDAERFAAQTGVRVF
jgi:carbamoyltransferase